MNDFSLGKTNRATDENMFPGGKGLNVSTVLKNLGIVNIALGFIAGFLAGWENTRNYESSFKMAVAAGSASAYSEELATKDEIVELLKYFE